jgi:hypothetical protein
MTGPYLLAPLTPRRAVVTDFAFSVPAIAAQVPP